MAIIQGIGYTTLACALMLLPPGILAQDNTTSESETRSTAGGDGRPNILFIVADDMGFTDIGSFGSEIATPNLDRLAHAGLRLNNLHAAQACRPTRLMLMASAGAEAASRAIPGAFRDSALGLDYATMAELLQDAGYSTFMTGKWDLGNVAGYTPADRGFDRSFAFLTSTSGYFADRFQDDFEEDGRPLAREDLPADYYSTRVFTDKMLEYLRSAEPGRPWFAYMAHNAPHLPLQLPDDWLDRYAGRYDEGYDALREERFARAVDAGVIPPGADLEGFQPLAEPWSNLSAEEQRRYARAQEIYAGVVEYLDMSIGWVIDYLAASGNSTIRWSYSPPTTAPLSASKGSARVTRRAATAGAETPSRLTIGSRTSVGPTHTSTMASDSARRRRRPSGARRARSQKAGCARPRSSITRLRSGAVASAAPS